jgi:hypothetical protein
MIKTIYYYENLHSAYQEDLEYLIAKNEVYDGEEGLMRIFENDIGVIEDEEYLKQYCMEYGEDYDVMLSTYEVKEDD